MWITCLAGRLIVHREMGVISANCINVIVEIVWYPNFQVIWNGNIVGDWIVYIGTDGVAFLVLSDLYDIHDCLYAHLCPCKGQMYP